MCNFREIRSSVATEQKWENPMGMYDTLHLTCPHCHKHTEFQSKASKCDLIDYTIYDAPLTILADAQSEELYCDNCRKKFVLRVQYMVHEDIAINVGEDNEN
ncbi:MAG TPA: hypothetical protein VJ044_10085 [Candidatus Hodarchaeales archaeon]|nr:hypothetical protein [Candidatus Hodarchaeales archaeon]